MIDSQLIWFDLYLGDNHVGTFSIKESLLLDISALNISQYVADNIGKYIGGGMSWKAFVDIKYETTHGITINAPSILAWTRFESNTYRLHVGNIRRV